MARDVDDDAPRRRADLIRRDALVEEHRPHRGVADHRRSRASRDRRRVSVVVERGMADEDHVRRLDGIGRERRERIVREERVHDDAVRRAEDSKPAAPQKVSRVLTRALGPLPSL